MALEPGRVMVAWITTRARSKEGQQVLIFLELFAIPACVRHGEERLVSQVSSESILLHPSLLSGI